MLTGAQFGRQKARSFWLQILDLCAWAAGAEEAIASTAAIKLAGTFIIIELRMVVLLLEGVSPTAFTY